MKDMTLAEVAKENLGSDENDKVRLLFDINTERVKLPAALPADTAMRMPQRNSPALIAFGVLALLLILVGRGWLLKTKEDEA
jgi:hypothetical protein